MHSYAQVRQKSVVYVLNNSSHTVKLADSKQICLESPGRFRYWQNMFNKHCTKTFSITDTSQSLIFLQAKQKLED